MELNGEQKEAVADWVRAGQGLSDIQGRIKTDFGIAMTYMDVRFLVLDLGVSVKDRKDRKPAPVAAAAASPEAVMEDEYDDEPDTDDAEPIGEDAMGGIPGSSVAVDIDRLIKPGALVSGSVTFTDGVKAKWALDQMGRLTLDSGKPDYKPSESDIRAFQLELRRALERKGF